MEVTIVLGSIRPARQTHSLAYFLQEQLTKKGMAVTLIDLKEFTLPLFGSVLSEEEEKKIGRITAYLKNSAVIVLVTPEYLSTVPAALKNILEYCGACLSGKTVGIASTSATTFGGLNASNHLLISLYNLGAYNAPRRLLVPEIHLAFDQNNQPMRQEISDQAERFVSELLTYTTTLTNKVP